MIEFKHQALSRDNPWPGLTPFDEQDRDFFYGRSAEWNELLLRVRREPLTVFFGRSGLGKTSLLKAGLFPRLPAEDCLPVYLRLDHAAEAPDLCEQIFRGLQAVCEGHGVQMPPPAPKESLWSYFHRRDAELWSATNRLVTPVIVFDQFEEIFTLGQKTEAARARSAAFLTDLGDLVENRPPGAVRHALENEPTAVRRFNFKHSTAKLVLSFREDFLAEMEGLKKQMPSLMYNRFRLLAMNGAQAYEVITRAGGHLVDDEVARRILRLSWKNEANPPVDPADFPKIEIDPALLSVVCRELNHKRQQAKPVLEHITPKLLEGADREILSEFYERDMADLDPRVRAFVEDELLTRGGYRDSCALEDALTLPGVTREALETLIRRRLLRVDERQSVQRLELAHDVLTGVVKESRDSRRERAALAQERRNSRIKRILSAGAVLVIGLAAFTGWAAHKETQLLHQAEIGRLMATAERLQDVDYDLSLLVNLEAVRKAQTLDTQSGLLGRLVSHPHLSTFLRGHSDEVSAVAFSPGGKLLASASRDDTIVLWDLGTRKSMARLKGHKNEVLSIAFSPDGQRLASASADTTIVLWDLDSRKTLTTLEGHHGAVTSVAFSRDGKQLASASVDKTVVLWDLDSRKQLATLERHKDAVTSVAFSPDGKQLASASRDKTVVLWDLDSRKPLATLEGHTDVVTSVAFSPDGKQLASASEDHSVILWDLIARKALSTLKEHKRQVLSVAFNPDGKRLASASWDNTVILWDLSTGKPITTLMGHKDPIDSIAFSPDGRWLASAGGDNAVILWDLDTRNANRTLITHKSALGSVAFSSNGKRLAAAGWDDTVLVENLDTHKVTLLAGHKGRVYSVAFGSDGKLASASWDRTIILWDLDTRERPAILTGHKDKVFSVAFSADGKRLASAGDDNTIILWDLSTRKPQTTLTGHKGRVSSVAFSPNGKRLASASWDSTVMLWDLETRKRLATLPGQGGWVLSVAFSPDGKRLASAGWDKNVVLWDPDSHKPLGRLAGHKDWVSSVAFSPDGQRLASASGDGTVILWDVDSRRPLVTLPGHQDAVLSVAFSPDGKRLASASADNNVILWNLDLKDLKAEACRIANRNLTCDEWRSYLGEEPYHKTCRALSGPEAKCD
ncbi:MAG TPA: hypothetical protein VGR07_05265 [Thermoanaerobaculia bacterium]|nr:hypothetical protein [Thermoanaerobaculia bacterium]